MMLDIVIEREHFTLTSYQLIGHKTKSHELVQLNSPMRSVPLSSSFFYLTSIHTSVIYKTHLNIFFVSKRGLQAV